MGERYADVVDRMDSSTARCERFGQRFPADCGVHMVLRLRVIGVLVVVRMYMPCLLLPPICMMLRSARRYSMRLTTSLSLWG